MSFEDGQAAKHPIDFHGDRLSLLRTDLAAQQTRRIRAGYEHGATGKPQTVS